MIRRLFLLSVLCGCSPSPSGGDGGLDAGIDGGAPDAGGSDGGGSAVGVYWVKTPANRLTLAAPWLAKTPRGPTYETLTWTAMEPTQGARSYSRTDLLVAACNQYSNDVALRLRIGAGWMNGLLPGAQLQSGSSSLPLDMATYLAWVKDVVTRYAAPPYSVHHWAIENEVSFPGFWWSSGVLTVTDAVITTSGSVHRIYSASGSFTPTMNGMTVLAFAPGNPAVALTSFPTNLPSSIATYVDAHTLTVPIATDTAGPATVIVTPTKSAAQLAADYQTLFTAAVPVIRATDPQAFIVHGALPDAPVIAAIASDMTNPSSSLYVNDGDGHTATDFVNAAFTRTRTASAMLTLPNTSQNAKSLASWLARPVQQDWMTWTAAVWGHMAAVDGAGRRWLDGYQMHYYNPPNVLAQILAYYEAHLPPVCPIAVWELGENWSSTSGVPFDPLAQKSDIETLLPLLLADPQITRITWLPAIWYRTCGSEDVPGVLDCTTGSERPGAASLVAIARAHLKP